MTQYLPPNLLALFAARDPIPYVPPVDKLGHEKRRIPYGGLSHLVNEFEDPKDTPPPTRVETREERKERKRKERAEAHAYKLEQDLALWDPAGQHAGFTDAFKSLFVARINFDSSESKLRREFEIYGPIRKITLINDRNSGKPRGYAFIEYEHERDMHSAYKHADGKKIDGRRVLVDVERGRTVKGWRPRRLGGGLGGTRKGGPEENTRFSGREGSYREDRRSRSRERPVERERDREPRRRRSRSREREERRKRSPGRERERERRRSRSRERRNKDWDDRAAGPEDEEEEGGRKDRKRTRRSRSRDRKRSRSRDRKRSRRSRSRERRRSRDRRIKEEPGADGEMGDPGIVKIKEEKVDEDYRYGVLREQINQEAEEDKKNFDLGIVKTEEEEEEEGEDGEEEEEEGETGYYDQPGYGVKEEKREAGQPEVNY